MLMGATVVESSLKKQLSNVVLITGCSKGIGYALSLYYLQNGYTVCGISRTKPDIEHPSFYWQYCDLTQHDAVLCAVSELYDRVKGASLELLFLNAGTFGDAPKKAHTVDLVQFNNVFAINALAVKSTLDALLHIDWRPKIALASASISSIRPRAGMLSYAVSKAALNSIVKIYQLENPDIFFLSLGLCNVKTSIYHAITDGVSSELPELFALKKRAQEPGYVISAKQRAEDMAKVVERLDELQLEKGNFYEIRTLLKTMNLASA